MTTKEPHPLFGNLGIKEFFAVGALIVSATLAIDAIRDDSADAVNRIDRKLDAFIQKLDTLEQEQTERARIISIDLWIERARQAQDLKSLPDFPH